MVYYCKKCQKPHSDEELCPYFKRQIKNNPNLLSEAATFTNVAAQYHLVTSQSLDAVAHKVNSIVGTNLSFEGTHQFARDIQVFNRLNVESFPRAGVFNSPELAKTYLENASKNQLQNLKCKIVGAGQEVDWLRAKQGELQSIFRKSTLLTGNAPGVDGKIVNRFTGKEITRVTIKGASVQGGIKTGTDGIIEALKKGTVAPDEVAFVTEGMKKRLLNDLERNIKYANETGDTATAKILTEAKKHMKIIENGSIDKTCETRNRILEKIQKGNAETSISMNAALYNAAQGAVIGAAVGLTISSLTNYIKYRNGELSRKEAFINIGEETLKSVIIGGAMGAITLFLPAGPLGFVAGFAIGIYLNAALTNILDEIFGKGAYLEILTAGGYILGTSMNLSAALQEFGADREGTRESFELIEKAQRQITLELQNVNKKLEVL